MKLPQSKFLRRFLLVILIVGVAGGGYYGLRYGAWAAYRNWSIGRMNTLAAKFLAEGDANNALLTARAVLRTRPNDLGALRLAVKAADQRSMPDAVMFQQNLVRLEKTPADSLELIRLALRYRIYSYALDAIDNVDEQVRKLPEFHRLAAQVYRDTNRDTEAREHLLSLLQLASQDRAAQRALAEVEFEVEPGRVPADWAARVQALTNDPEQGAAARILQLRAALAREDTREVARLAAQLRMRMDLDLGQRLVVAEAVRRSSPAEAEKLLTGIKQAAAADPASVVQVMDHFRGLKQNREAVEWAETLPPAIKDNDRVQFALARSRLELGQWKELEAELQKARWPANETWKFVLLARAYRENGRRDESSGAWKRALAATGQDPAAVLRLLRTVESWHWDDERYEALWKLFNLIPVNESIQAPLIARELRAGRTANLNKIYARIIEAQPGNEEARNNFAYTSLLLDTNTGRAQIIARDLYRAHPKNPAYLGTYALALFKKGDAAEALALVEKADSAARVDPGVRLPEALASAATRQGVAVSLLVREAERQALLPEEKNLIADATSTLARNEQAADRTALAARTASRPGEGGGWIALLPRAPEDAPEVRLADAYYRDGKTAELKQLVQDPRWPGPGHLRYALLAYIDRTQGGAARDLWRQALAEAGRDARQLRDLEALATKWKWEPERLQTMTQRFEAMPGDRALLSELLTYYRAESRTAELARLLWLYVNQTDTNGPEAAWCVYYSFLCHTNVASAQTLAARIYPFFPKENNYRIVYAFALWRQNRPEEAWKLLEGIKAQDAGGMQPLLIEAGVLADLGRKAEAKKALDGFAPASAMPEELALAETLSRQIGLQTILTTAEAGRAPRQMIANTP